MESADDRLGEGSRNSDNLSCAKGGSCERSPLGEITVLSVVVKMRNGLRSAIQRLPEIALIAAVLARLQTPDPIITNTLSLATG